STDPPAPLVRLPVLKESGQAKVTFNERKNEAISQTAFLRVFGKSLDGIGLVARFTSPGKIVAKPEKIILGISPAAKDRTYVDDRTVKIFLGKKQLLSSTSKFVSANSDGRIIVAALEQEIPYKDFIKLSKAKQVKMQIGPTEFELKESDIQAFSDLLKTIEN
ncbi:MAG TPA: hypothetical protein VK308_04625, partial [Pyrinomonadaceae bacterium]|nr:hypothetical protein [Pyrinomonadaceae bacterium]